MQEMFEKLERLKYGNNSIKQNNRIHDYWDNLNHDELEDVESFYEYIIEQDNN